MTALDITCRRARSSSPRACSRAARSLAARAADKPPMRVILPIGAGSGVDTIVRAAAPALTKALGGQPVVIENLPGAGGITGTSALVKAPPDGNTIAFLSNNHAVNPSVYKKMPYDSLADITPISVVGATPFVLVVNPTSCRRRTPRSWSALLKAKPGAYNLASSGNGTIIHLAGEMFVDAAGVDAKHIPYKGVGPMVADLIGGQVDFGVVAVPAVAGAPEERRAARDRRDGQAARRRRCPTCRRSPSKASPTSTSPAGSPSSAPPKLPPRRSSACTTRSSRRSTTRRAAAMAKQENVINPSTPEAAAQILEERAGALCSAREEGQHLARLTHSRENPTWRSIGSASKAPQVADPAYVAAEATLIGDVVVGERASVWPGAVARGDNEPIRSATRATSRKARCCTPTRAFRSTSARTSRSATRRCCTAARSATAR